MADTKQTTEDGYARITGPEELDALIGRASQNSNWDSLAVLGPRAGRLHGRLEMHGFNKQEIFVADAKLDIQQVKDVCRLTRLRALCLAGHSLPADGARAIAASL